MGNKQSVLKTYETAQYASGNSGEESKNDGILINKTRNKNGVNMLMAVVADKSNPSDSTTNPPGAIAVKMVAEFFNSQFFENLKIKNLTQGLEKMEDNLRELFNRINTVIYTLMLNEQTPAGTSISAVFVIEQMLYAVQAGAGSIVKMRRGEATTLLAGNSWVSEVIKQSRTDPDKILSSPEDIKSDALGLSNKVEVRIAKEYLEMNEQVFLLSEGINEYLPEKEIQVILKAVDTLPGACNRLVSIALERGYKGIVSAAAFYPKVNHDALEKPRRDYSTTIYKVILTIVILLMIVGAYVGYHFAMKLAGNMDLTHDPRHTAGKDNPLMDKNNFYLVKDAGCDTLSVSRFNSKQLPEDFARQEVLENNNTLEVMPVMEKGTYMLTLKCLNKASYRIYESSTRNTIQIFNDEVNISLTQGASALIKPNEIEGITIIEITGLASPAIIVFNKQSIIFKTSTNIEPQVSN